METVFPGHPAAWRKSAARLGIHGAWHIALGGDLDGCSQLPQGFTGVDSYQPLAERLLERGLTEQNVMDIYWNNALGVMSTALRDNKID